MLSRTTELLQEVTKLSYETKVGQCFGLFRAYFYALLYPYFQFFRQEIEPWVALNIGKLIIIK